MKGLTDVEVVFLKLAWFFEAPEQEGFNIGLFFHHLNNDWLEFTLELVTQFFLEDMYLIEKPPIPFFKKHPTNILIQKQFADFLSAHGLNYDKRKLNVYYSRGLL